MNNNLEAEKEMNASTSKDICNKMMQKINQQSLENQLADYILRSDQKKEKEEEKEEDEDFFNVGDADEDCDF